MSARPSLENQESGRPPERLFPEMSMKSTLLSSAQFQRTRPRSWLFERSLQARARLSHTCAESHVR